MKEIQGESVDHEIGLVEAGTERGDYYGLSLEWFDSESYLFLESEHMMLSLVISVKKGALRQLVARLHALGIGVKILSPIRDMKRIVKKNGYRQTWEECDIMGDVEVWVLDPPVLDESKEEE